MLSTDADAVDNKVGSAATLPSSAVVLLRLHGHKGSRCSSYGIMRSAAVTYRINFFYEGTEGFCYSILTDSSDESGDKKNGDWWLDKRK